MSCAKKSSPTGFNPSDALIRQLDQGLPRLAAGSERRRSLTAWPWIIRHNGNAE